MKVMPGYVLIKPQEEELKTASGLVLPDSSKEKPMIGEVVGRGANSPESHDIDWKVLVGDRVIFKKWAGHEYKKDVFIKLEEILAVL